MSVILNSLKRTVKATINKIHHRPRQFGLVVGCPRSGTTALSGWLNSNAGLLSYNETRVLIGIHSAMKQFNRFQEPFDNREMLLPSLRDTAFRYYANFGLTGGKLLIDKEPLEPVAFPERDYCDFIINMKLLFPRLRLIYIVRHPVATIWSMRQRKWGFSLKDREPWDLDLDECIEIWKDNAKLILNSPVDDCFLCKFEDLVNTPQKASKALLDYLGMSYGKVFTPRPTKIPAFIPDEQEWILANTIEERSQLGYDTDG